MRLPRILLTSVFLKSLRDQLGAIAAWGGGLAALCWLTLLFYPAVQGLGDINRILQQMPQLSGFLGDIASFTSLEGYTTSSLLVYLPLVLAIYTIATAVGMIGGEITSGTMDFLLEHPVTRGRVVLEKFAALVVAVLAIGALTGLGLWLGGITINADIGFDRWLLAGLNLVPLTLFFGALAFMLSCAVRGRGVAIGVASAVAVGGFILNGLAPLVASLRTHREWTIYYLFAAGKPLSAGINMGDAAILLAGSLICLVIAVLAFDRRDMLA